MLKIMDYSQIKQNWEKRGFSFGVWSDPPGQIWADYTHDTDELVMLAEGEIELSFGGQILRPRVGEEILIPAREPHTVRNIGQTTNRWYYGYKHKSMR
ncbi:cupin domain-containing protein [Hydrococcus rivularis]|nr:cupin domain-containing protein [Hydrococcus rivularis]